MVEASLSCVRCPHWVRRFYPHHAVHANQSAQAHPLPLSKRAPFQPGEKAADKGDADAMSYLGAIYYNGEGARQPECGRRP